MKKQNMSRHAQYTALKKHYSNPTTHCANWAGHAPRAVHGMATS
jgi:hypothetical protein